MTIHERFTAAVTGTEAVATGRPAPSLRTRLRERWARIAAWLATARDYHAAAAAYEELCRLSEAELARRGLSRDTLARDACRQHDRAER